MWSGLFAGWRHCLSGLKVLSVFPVPQNYILLGSEGLKEKAEEKRGRMGDSAVGLGMVLMQNRACCAAFIDAHKSAVSEQVLRS